jgi:hypothetical protein
MTGIKLALGSAVLSAAGITTVDAIEKAGNAGEWLSKLPATAMLGVALIVSLMTGGYIIVQLFQRGMKLLEANIAMMQRVCDAIQKCEDRNRGIH